MMRIVFLFLVLSACSSPSEQPATASAPQIAPVSRPVVLGPICLKAIKETEEFCARKDINKEFAEGFCTPDLLEVIKEAKKNGATEKGCQKSQDALNQSIAFLEKEKKKTECVSSYKPVDFDVFRYDIEHVTSSEEFDGDSKTQKASKGASFVWIEYKVTNTGKETIHISIDNLELIDAQKRVFKASTPYSREMAMKKKLDFYGTDLQPTLPKSLVQVFELPTESTKKGLKLRIRSGKLFDDEIGALVCIN